MIFSFDDTLKTDDNGQRQLLAKCLVMMNEKCHRIDRGGFYFDFIEKEVMHTDYMGKMDINQIKSNHNLFDVTTSDRLDFRCVKIGYGSDMCPPEEVYIILEEPSLVAVENSTNDGSVIRRWAESYSDEDNVGDLNKTVFEAIEDNRVRFLHGGGGNGTIIKRIEDQLKVYGKYTQMKITSVFDSDKNSLEDPGQNQTLKYYLDENHYDYHCLVKREMENYFPLKVYQKCGLLNEEVEIPNYTEEEWDYVKIKEDDDKKQGEQKFLSYNKKELPNLAARAKKKHFKQRIRHQQTYNSHYGEVDEIQHILLMIAKFV